VVASRRTNHRERENRPKLAPQPLPDHFLAPRGAHLRLNGAQVAQPALPQIQHRFWGGGPSSPAPTNQSRATTQRAHRGDVWNRDHVAITSFGSSTDNRQREVQGNGAVSTAPHPQRRSNLLSIQTEAHAAPPLPPYRLRDSGACPPRGPPRIDQPDHAHPTLVVGHELVVLSPVTATQLNLITVASTAYLQRRTSGRRATIARPCWSSLSGSSWRRAPSWAGPRAMGAPAEPAYPQIWPTDFKTSVGLRLPLPELGGALEDSDCTPGTPPFGRRRAPQQVHREGRGRWPGAAEPAREDPHVHPLSLFSQPIQVSS
jgi:hypothetical protein